MHVDPLLAQETDARLRVARPSILALGLRLRAPSGTNCHRPMAGENMPAFTQSDSVQSRSFITDLAAAAASAVFHLPWDGGEPLLITRKRMLRWVVVSGHGCRR